MPWYTAANRIVLAIAKSMDEYARCPDCGKQEMKKNNFGDGYYCYNCFANSKAILENKRYYPSNTRRPQPAQAPAPVRPQTQPLAVPTVAEGFSVDELKALGHKFNTDNPKAVCDICGNSGPKAIRKGGSSYYCWVGWMLSAGRDPGPEFLANVKPAEPETAQTPDFPPETPLPAVSEFGDEMIGTDEGKIPPKTEAVQTTKGEVAKPGLSEEERVENDMKATGIYANGQPEADLLEGDEKTGIRIYSEEHLATMFSASVCKACGKVTRGGKERCDTCGAPLEDFGEPLIQEMTKALSDMQRQITPGVQNYVGLAPLLAQAKLDIEQGGQVPEMLKDPAKAPIILDQSVDNPEEFIDTVMQNPLFLMSDIGKKGYRPNISQAIVLDALARTNKNMTILLPTGSGKTTCAEVAIAKGLMWGKTEDTLGRKHVEHPVAVYIAPARALTTQIAEDFSGKGHPFSKMGWKVRMEVGGGQQKVKKDVAPEDEKDDDVPASLKDLQGTADPSIVIITPERLLTCLQNPTKHPWVRQVTTFIFDEGHLIGDPDRGPKFQAEQIKLYEMFKAMKGNAAYEAARIMFMSATMDNALELSSWQDSLVSNKPAPQLDAQGNVIEPTEEEMEAAALKSNWALAWGDTKPVQINRKFSPMPTATPEDSSEETLYLVDLMKASLKKQVMYDDKKGDRRQITSPTLFFVHSKRVGYQLQGICRDFFRECSRCGGIFESEVGDDGFPIEKKIWEEWCPMCGADNNDSPEEWDEDKGKNIKKWIVNPYRLGFHHRGAKQKDKLVKDFNEFKSPFLVATSTLAAGVNTGAWNVHIMGASRGNADVDVASIIQMAGRAGRQSFARLFSQIAPEVDERNGKELPFGASVTFHADSSNFLYHSRRIQAGTFLEGGMASDIHYPDVLLLLVNMGLIKHVADAGKYLGKSFDFLQSEVDRQFPMNPRLALKQIAHSAGDAADPNNQFGGDAIEWIGIEHRDEAGNVISTEEPPEWCQHISVGLDWKDARDEIQRSKDKRAAGETVAAAGGAWIVHCRDCGASGMLENTQEIKDKEVFDGVADSALRDLIGAGFLTCDMDTGQLKITDLGQRLAKQQVESATVVDIIKNMSKLRQQQQAAGSGVGMASDLQIAEALTKTRTNNDEDRGAFITVAQTHGACKEACDAYYPGGLASLYTQGPKGPIPIAAPDPFIKVMQCVYWLLDGKDPEEIYTDHADMVSDYRGVTDSYGGMLMSALDYVFVRAKWFADNGTRMSSIQVQLKNGVSPEAAVFAVADGIGQKTASGLQRAGFVDLQDVHRASDKDPRFAIYFYYMKGLDKRAPDRLPPTLARPSWQGMDAYKVASEVKRVKTVVTKALEGKIDGKYDSSYEEKVRALNDPKWIAGLRSKKALAKGPNGWYRFAIRKNEIAVG